MLVNEVYPPTNRVKSTFGIKRAAKEMEKNHHAMMRTLPEVVETLAKQTPNARWVKIPVSSGSGFEWRDVTWLQLRGAVNSMCHWMETTLGPAKINETVAYSGISDIRYPIMVIASMKMGYKSLLTSPRNSEEGQIFLLNSTRCTKFVYTKAHSTTIGQLAEKMGSLTTAEMPALDDLLQTGKDAMDYRTKEAAPHDTAVILHSSGTTGLPKPVHISFGALAAVDSIKQMHAPSGRRNLHDELFSDTLMVSMMPFFHIMGIVLLARSIYHQGPLVLLPPEKPVTAELVIYAMTQTRPSALAVAPSILEEVSSTQDGMDALSQLEGVFYGGAPLASSCGDKISKVTSLFNTIGSTEALNIACYKPLDRTDWDYFEFNPLSGTVLEETSGNKFELVIKQKFNREHQFVFHNFPDVSEWRTKDLFEQHPERPGLWKYAGRIDDIIVLSNGEKFNPISFEKIIEGHPWVQGALMVGQKRFQAGLIIEPRRDKTPVDSEVFLREIWPLVERANEQYPTHARVWSSMVLVADSRKPFRRSPKGSVVRRTTCELYEAEIASLYEHDTATLKTGASDEIISSQDDANTVQAHVRDAIQSVLGTPSREIGQDENIFLLGMNSLQVLQLSKILGSRMHERHISSAVCSPRAIYQNPTIKRLAHAITTALRNNDSADTNGNSRPIPSREGIMSKMIYEHTRTLPKRDQSCTKNAKARRGGHIVALTGSTGSLGSNLLHRLVTETDVEHIFCLNRSGDAEERQKKSFNERGMDWSSLRSRVDFLTVDLNQEGFGLDPALYSTLLRSVDVFIHNAWPVNFNNDLEYFEAAAVGGMRRCVDFVAAADHSPHFVFISSIASVGNYPQVRSGGQAIPEEFEEDNSLPLAQGYGESKHVASCILRRAARTSGISATIMRVGQLCGPERGGGVWNKQEWLPSLIITSKNLGRIPRSLGSFDELDWVPVDRAAQAIVELTLSRTRTVGSGPQQQPPHDDDEVACFNVVNPRPAAWAELLCAAQAFFDARGSPVESVSFSEWIDEVSKLQEVGGQGHDDALERYPAAKLADFFREMERSALTAKLMFATDLSVTQSQTMADLRPITGDLVERWLEGWGY